jgi:hypothetical protein
VTAAEKEARELLARWPDAPTPEDGDAAAKLFARRDELFPETAWGLRAVVTQTRRAAALACVADIEAKDWDRLRGSLDRLGPARSPARDVFHPVIPGVFSAFPAICAVHDQYAQARKRFAEIGPALDPAQMPPPLQGLLRGLRSAESLRMAERHTPEYLRGRLDEVDVWGAAVGAELRAEVAFRRFLSGDPEAVTLLPKSVAPDQATELLREAKAAILGQPVGPADGPSASIPAGVRELVPTAARTDWRGHQRDRLDPILARLRRELEAEIGRQAEVQVRKAVPIDRTDLEKLHLDFDRREKGLAEFLSMVAVCRGLPPVGLARAVAERDARLGKPAVQCGLSPWSKPPADGLGLFAAAGAVAASGGAVPWADAPTALGGRLLAVRLFGQARLKDAMPEENPARLARRVVIFADSPLDLYRSIAHEQPERTAAAVAGVLDSLAGPNDKFPDPFRRAAAILAEIGPEAEAALPALARAIRDPKTPEAAVPDLVDAVRKIAPGSLVKP